MTLDSPSNIYQQVQVNTSNNLRLVAMLYDGAIRFLTEAKVFIENKNVPGKAQAIDRSLAILGELQSTLNFEEGGEITISLDKLYTYMIECILEASSTMTVGPLGEVIKLLRMLNSALSEVAEKVEMQNQQAPSPSMPMVPAGRDATSSSQRPLEVFV